MMVSRKLLPMSISILTRGSMICCTVLFSAACSAVTLLGRFGGSRPSVISMSVTIFSYTFRGLISRSRSFRSTSALMRSARTTLR